MIYIYIPTFYLKQRQLIKLPWFNKIQVQVFEQNSRASLNLLITGLLSLTLIIYASQQQKRVIVRGMKLTRNSKVEQELDLLLS